MNNNNIFVNTTNRKEGIMEIFQKVCLAFPIIGAINWGLIGLFDFNLVHFLFGNMGMIENAVYLIVCICGIINIGIYFIDFRHDHI